MQRPEPGLERGDDLRRPVVELRVADVLFEHLDLAPGFFDGFRRVIIHVVLLC